MAANPRRVQVFLQEGASSSVGKVLCLPETTEELVQALRVAFSLDEDTHIKLQTKSGAEMCDVNLIQNDEVLYLCLLEKMEEKKNSQWSANCPNDWINLNVGGTIFSTTRSTLIGRETNSMLAKMFQDSKQWRNTVDGNGNVLLDRCPKYFEPILGYLRHGKMIIEPSIDPRGVLEEANFFGMMTVAKQVQNIIRERKKENYEEPLTRCMVVKALLVTPAKCELRFQGINFSGADLSRLDLRYINFKLANLSHCNLAQANLYCCSLERADLTGSILDGANLQGVRMICCNAEGCSMKGCNFDDPSGLKANMEGANMKGVNFEGSLMAGANLRVATVKNSNLKNCNLRGAILAGTDLENCDLSGCDLFEANLRGCNVKGTKFEEMITPLHMTQAVP
uniref:BTB/POZ domain-containing protein KCTD9 n=1 Tax=Phallusia mammillata TaxID=59560 RepID=A0A6F9DF34_9ASCI|nr:BTB/POZ domain-containing protein KCTD9 [Phallusia mammillata]